MARIAGVNIPTHKRVPIALTYIHGIGPSIARQICEATGIEMEDERMLEAYRAGDGVALRGLRRFTDGRF